ncbi:hypothetical protein SNEBB_003786 [Seison nebaliae]|nr:hypothetical protein SNEBB_003786 [Seison nebaliae]
MGILFYYSQVMTYKRIEKSKNLDRPSYLFNSISSGIDNNKNNNSSSRSLKQDFKQVIKALYRPNRNCNNYNTKKHEEYPYFQLFGSDALSRDMPITSFIFHSSQKVRSAASDCICIKQRRCNLIVNKHTPPCIELIKKIVTENQPKRCSVYGKKEIMQPSILIGERFTRDLAISSLDDQSTLDDVSSDAFRSQLSLVRQQSHDTAVSHVSINRITESNYNDLLTKPWPLCQKRYNRPIGLYKSFSSITTLNENSLFKKHSISKSKKGKAVRKSSCPQIARNLLDILTDGIKKNSSLQKELKTFALKKNKSDSYLCAKDQLILTINNKPTSCTTLSTLKFIPKVPNSTKLISQFETINESKCNNKLLSETKLKNKSMLSNEKLLSKTNKCDTANFLKNLKKMPPTSMSKLSPTTIIGKVTDIKMTKKKLKVQPIVAETKKSKARRDKNVSNIQQREAERLQNEQLENNASHKKQQIRRIKTRSNHQNTTEEKKATNLMKKYCASTN